MVWNQNNGWISPQGLFLPQQTPADLESAAGRAALENIPGSAKGARPEDYATAARAVYPVFDGITNLLPGKPTDIAGFPEWHSAHQIEELRGRPDTELAFTSGGRTVAYYFLATGGNTDAGDDRVVNAMGLTLSDYAQLHPDDQRKVADIDAREGLGILSALGLSVVTAEQKDKLLDNPLYTFEGLSKPPQQALDDSTLTATDKAVFAAQFDMLRAEMDRSHAVNLDVMAGKISEILTRLERADAFYAVSQRPPADVNMRAELRQLAGSGGPFTYAGASDPAVAAAVFPNAFIQNRVSSLDDGQRVASGFDTFMKAERTILTMKTRREAIGDDGAFRDPRRDLPNLIFQLQLLYEGEAEGLADSGTELIRQLHGLLEDYGVMQRLVNETLRAFDPSDSNDRRRFMNIGARSETVNPTSDERMASLAPIDNDADFRNRNFTDRFTGAHISTPIVVGDNNQIPHYHWSVLAKQDNPVSDMHRRFNAHWETQDQLEGDVSGKLDETEMRAFSMFAEANWATAGGRDHPIERLLASFDRPSFRFITTDKNEGQNGSLELHSSQAWNNFQTSLSDAITILNQENQLRQNEIENATKQQNRHFELGNNALRKMNDLLLSIGRA